MDIQKQKKLRPKRTNRENKPKLNVVKQPDLTSEGHCYFPELNNCSGIKDFKQKIHNIIHSMGFSDFSFIRLENAEAMDMQVLSTVPRVYTKSYCEQGFFENDAMIDYTATRETPIFRSDLDHAVLQLPFDNDTTRTSKSIQELDQKYGFLDFYCLPGISLDGSRVLFSVSARGKDNVVFKKEILSAERSLQVLAKEIDSISRIKYERYLGVDGHKSKKEEELIRLTEAPRRVLQKMAQTDCKVKQLAKSLNVSPLTINKHLESARRALYVDTTHAAIVKAYRLGFIHFDEDEE